MNLSAIWPKEAPPIDEAKKFLEKYKNKNLLKMLPFVTRLESIQWLFTGEALRSNKN